MKARARSGLYAFFSRIFVRELDDAAVEALSGPLGRELLPELQGSDEPALARDPERRVAVLDTDFVSLTIVNLVPSESFYRRNDAMVEGGVTNPVAQFLKSYGFETDLAQARALAPDHVGIELEMMAILCAHEAEAAERPDAAYAAHIRGVQRSFLREHLLAWAPMYFFAVERCAHTTLYREAARVAMRFIASDYEALCAEVTP